jgi:glycylpeptide N-tetradecanoyltransferase
MSEAEKANETKAPAAAAAAASSSAASTASSPEDLLKQQNELLKLFGHSAISNKPQEPAPHKFWNTQPVPDKRDAEQQHGALEEKTVADVRQKPYDLPKGFEWVDLDVSKQEDIDDVYMLLYENYVEDDDNMFRFDYR